MPHSYKRTKIVCTIGPSSGSVSTLERMIRAGMNVARLNFSHGSYVEHRRLVGNIRAAAARMGVPVGIMADLQGPKVRVGLLPKDGVKLAVGSIATFEAGREIMMGATIPIPYAGLPHDLAPGDHILLDDGLIEVRVLGIRGRTIRTRVTTPGLLTSHKGLNVPTTTLRLAAVTEKDFDDLRFAITQNVDFVALSFVRSAADVTPVRQLLHRRAATRDIQIIAKIEKHEAVENIDKILAAVDGIMIARGDLGVEVPAELVPVIQKEVVEKCLRAAKPVIVATQMMDSMIRNPRPTRAEVSDVANAVIDHADAVMLSGETATGKYPVKAVAMMSRVIRETEASRFDRLSPEEFQNHLISFGEAMGEVARMLADAPHVDGIMVTTLTGASARHVARFRPKLSIVACTPSERVLRQLALSWAVVPVWVRAARTLPRLVSLSLRTVARLGIFKRGAEVLLVTGRPVGKPGTTNQVEIVKL